MTLENLISIASTIIFLRVAFTLWKRGFLFGSVIVATSISAAFAFVLIASFGSNLTDENFDFHLWFRVLGLASTIGFFAIGVVFLQVVKFLPNPSLKPTR